MHAHNQAHDVSDLLMVGVLHKDLLPSPLNTPHSSVIQVCTLSSTSKSRAFLNAIHIHLHVGALDHFLVEIYWLVLMHYISLNVRYQDGY